MRRVFEEKARQVVAVILEPLQGAGGCNIPPAGYLRSVQELCREFGSTLILDEVKTGFGRTGHDWAFEAEGFKPDILCAGKSASAGLVPVSFVAGRESVMTCVEPGMIGTTWSATPLQCAALLQALQLLSKGDLAQEAQRKGAVLAGQFDELARTYPDFIVRLRGRALFCALEIKPEVTGRTFVNALLEEGLYTKELGRVNAVYVMPSLTISDALIEKGVGAFARAIARLA
jgi:acetylornithine/succinyldiaminopimelate/putrescine aminotransferase